jgi:hypothetical protein
MFLQLFHGKIGFGAEPAFGRECIVNIGEDEADSVAGRFRHVIQWTHCLSGRENGRSRMWQRPFFMQLFLMD